MPSHERTIRLVAQPPTNTDPLVRDGVASFLWLPVARERRDLDGVDAAIIGIPYDRPPTAGRPANQWSGFRDAPVHARKGSLRYRG